MKQLAVPRDNQGKRRDFVKGLAFYLNHSFDPSNPMSVDPDGEGRAKPFEGRLWVLRDLNGLAAFAPEALNETEHHVFKSFTITGVVKLVFAILAFLEL